MFPICMYYVCISYNRPRGCEAKIGTHFVKAENVRIYSLLYKDSTCVHYS